MIELQLVDYYDNEYIIFVSGAERMGSNNSQIDEKLPATPASKVTFCQRKKSENGSFVGTLRNHFHEFIHASMDERKTCLRNTIQKVIHTHHIMTLEKVIIASIICSLLSKCQL